MATEDSTLKGKQTWKLVPLIRVKSRFSNKWVFKVKTKADVTLDKLKARLVARGFEQMVGVDYVETFSPVVNSLPSG